MWQSTRTSHARKLTTGRRRLVQKVTASASSVTPRRALKAKGHAARTDHDVRVMSAPAAKAKNVRAAKALSVLVVMTDHAATSVAPSVVADLPAADHRAVMTTSRARRR